MPEDRRRRRSACPALSSIVETWPETEWLRRTLDAAGRAFVSLHPGGRVLACTRPAIETFGAELTGCDFGEVVVAPRMRPVFQATLRRATERRTRVGRELRVELAALHRDGHEVAVELAIVGVEIGGA